jgi:hypothetical protein
MCVAVGGKAVKVGVMVGDCVSATSGLLQAGKRTAKIIIIQIALA